jgi:acetyl-CoA acetyltransferase
MTIVAGVGMTPFGKHVDKRPEEIAGAAIRAAISDSGLDKGRIDAAFCGAVQLGMGIGQSVLREVGITGIPITNVENACASSGSALREAVAWVGSGAAEVALVFGVEQLTRTAKGLIDTGRASVAEEVGLPLPGLYALKARHHMDLYGTTAQQLAAVSVKNRRNGAANPHAHFKAAVTADEVLASPMISDPLTLLQCCPNVDGAAAIVVMSDAAAKRAGVDRPVQIAGMGVTSGRALDVAGAEPDATERAAAIAYEAAGVGPEDVDVCEVHEPFTIAEILHVEGLGFCAPGEGGKYIESGKADIDGDGVAVNPSGGLLSRGHPLGASGAAQVVEIVQQLRGEAGPRQREGARVGLAHIMGGNISELDSNACVIHIFKR